MTGSHHHIIVGDDGSAAAATAAEWAASEALRRRCGLTVIGCYSLPVVTDFGMSAAAIVAADLDGVRKHTEAQLAEQVERLRDGRGELIVNAAAVQGPARHVLAEQAANAELLVVGSSGAGEISSLLLGSVAFAVSRTSPCPVVVVPRALDTVDRGRIVVGVDTLDQSREALEWAADEADLRGAELIIVHAWDYPYATVPAEPETRDLMQVDAANELDRALQAVRQRSGAAVESRLVEGDPADALLAAGVDADLIVIGSRSRGALRAMVLGSTSNAVMTHAACPAVVVRRQRERDGGRS